VACDRLAAPRDVIARLRRIVLALVLIASPLTWTHYYALLLLPFTLYLTGRLELPDDLLTTGLMRASLVLVSLPVIDAAAIMPRFAEIIARTAASAWFLGGLLLFLALVRGLRHSVKAKA